MMATPDTASPTTSFETEDTIRLSSSFVSTASPSEDSIDMNGVSRTNMNQSGHVSSLYPGFNPPVLNLQCNDTTQSFSDYERSSISSSTTELADGLYPGNSIQSEFPLPNYSIFSNTQAATSVVSLPLYEPPSHFQGANQLFKINMESTPDLGTYWSNHAIETTRNLDLGNYSYDSISEYNNSTLPDLVDTSAGSLLAEQIREGEYPITPNLSDGSVPPIFPENNGLPPSCKSSAMYFALSPMSDENLVVSIPKSNGGIHKTQTPSLQRFVATKNNISQYPLNSPVLYTTPTMETSPQFNSLYTKYNGFDFQPPQSPFSTSTTPPIVNAGQQLPTMNVFHHKSDTEGLTNYANARYERHSCSSLHPPKKKGIMKPTKERKKCDANIHNNKTLDDGNMLSSSPVKKKYTRRRLLPRSKNGCWICRIKHLKCDEVRPACASCNKFGIECDYSPDKPEYVINKELKKQKLIEITMTRKRNCSGSRKKV